MRHNKPHCVCDSPAQREVEILWVMARQTKVPTQCTLICRVRLRCSALPFSEVSPQSDTHTVAHCKVSSVRMRAKGESLFMSESVRWSSRKKRLMNKIWWSLNANGEINVHILINTSMGQSSLQDELNITSTHLPSWLMEPLIPETLDSCDSCYKENHWRASTT